MTVGSVDCVVLRLEIAQVVVIMALSAVELSAAFAEVEAVPVCIEDPSA